MKLTYYLVLIHLAMTAMVFLHTAASIGAEQNYSDVSGQYVRYGENDEEELDVTLLPGDRVHVIGNAAWGTKTQLDSGVHTGQLDFIAPIINDHVVYVDLVHPVWKGQKYKIELIFRKGGLVVKEENALGYFGLNVYFEGEYTKR